MPVKHFEQTSFFSPLFIEPDCLGEDTVAWAIKELRRELFPRWLFRDWHGSGRVGRNAWPASILMTTLLLATYEGGLSRRGMVKRLKRDIVWRGACGLDFNAETPSESTFRRFERYLNQRDSNCGVLRIQLFHENVVRLCLEAEVVGEDAVWMMDSTPMWAYGAFHGTIRLIGDGLRTLATAWRQLTGQTEEELAEEWQIPMLTAKSTKGFFRINWKDQDERATVLHQLTEWALQAVETVRSSLGKVRRNKRKRLLRFCKSLMKVISDDLTEDEGGRLTIAHNPSGSRIVSFTDPQARSSRKSKSKPYKGYKVHLFGELVSGLITSLAVAPANEGDGTVAGRLLKRAASLCDNIHQVLADSAYRAAELHYRTRHLHSIDILAPNDPPKSQYPDRLGRDKFFIDTDQGIVVCPTGKVAHIRRTAKARSAGWSKSDCDECVLKKLCAAKSGRKVLQIHIFHEELEYLRARWETHEAKELYRRRSEGERLVNLMIQRGMRKARRWGLKAAVAQAYTAAAASNLIILAKKLRSQV